MKKLTFLKTWLLTALVLLGSGSAWGQYTGAGTFNKITSIGNLTDGYYVIMNSGDAFAMNNTYDGTFLANTAVTPSSNQIIDPATSIVWKIETNGSGRTIYNEVISKFVSYTGASNNVQVVDAVTTNNQRWNITYASSVFTVTNVALNTRMLQYNASSPRFACYTTAQQKLLLYKLIVPTVVTSSNTLTGFNYVVGVGPSSEQNITISGYDLTSNISITASTNYEISTTSGSGFTSQITLTQSGGTVASTTIYVRLKAGLSINDYNGELITLTTTGGNDKTISCSGTVSAPSPVITLSEASLTFDGTLLNSTSSEKSYTVTGTYLTSSISVTPPVGYEISTTTGEGFVSNPAVVTLSQTEGSVDATIYVRFVPVLAQTYSVNILHASTSAENVNLAVTGKGLYPAPTNHVTNFTATSNSYSSITVNWTDATGSQSPDGYLVKAAIDPTAPTAPSDGTAESDATLAKNIAFGVESVQFTGLNPSTSYIFSIWPFTNSGTDIIYKTDGVVPTVSETTEAVPVPNVIITEVYGGGGNASAPFTHDFVELFNTTSSVVDISNWSIQYYSATGTAATVVTIPANSKIPSKGHFLIQLSSGGSVGEALISPDHIGVVNMSATAGKVALFTSNTSVTVNTSNISSITGNVNFKDYAPFGTSATPLWGTVMSLNASATTSATRRKVEGVYVYTQDIGNDFEVVTPTPQNSGVFRSKASGNWGSTATWEFTDNGTWGNASIVPSSVSSPVQIATGHEVSVAASASSAKLTLKPGAKLSINTTNTLAVTGNLLLESDATGTSTLINNGRLTVSGTSSVQQHLKEARNWYLSSPISNAKLPSGFTTYQYLEPGNNDGFVAPATANWQSVAAGTTLTRMRGYTMRPSAAGIITFTTESGDTLNTGNQSIALTRSTVDFKPGYNLVGNPYPSHITWTNDIATGANLLSTIWYRTGVSGQYVFHTFNAAGGEGTTEGVTGVIAPMQAFWVRVAEGTTNTTLSLNNTMRSHQASNPLKAPAVDNKKVLRLQVSNDNHSDETVLYFLEGASAAYDTYDSPKMFNESKSVPEIYSIVDDVDLVINGMGSIPFGVEMPIGFVSAQSGLFSIKASTLKNFDETTQIILKDKYSNEAFDLTNGESYAFSSDATANKDRFSVIFKVAGSASDINGATSSSLRSYQNVSNQLVVNYTGTISESMTLTVYNTMGQKLLERQMNSSTIVLDKSLNSGVYLIMLNNGKTEIKSKVIVK